MEFSLAYIFGLGLAHANKCREGRASKFLSSSVVSGEILSSYCEGLRNFG